ncbi:MAG: choice-of-anchor Q domain-containing protein [Planctomycetota bacterium]|jgi:hypothetical protein
MKQPPGRDIQAFLLTCLLLSGAAHGQSVLYVDDDAPAAGDGTSWATALNDLQEALLAAAGSAGTVTEIRVAQGRYRPDGPGGDRTATFQLLNDVVLGGGYAGWGAADPDERDIAGYETILDGDLEGDDEPGGSNGENSYHVVAGGGVDATAVLDGFTISGGNADGSSQAGWGGGMYIGNGSPTLVNCRLSDNSAIFGGGMFNSYGSPTLAGCTFSGNSAAGSGGGMYNFADPAQQSSATLSDCTFSGNSAAGYGGGMRNWDSSPMLVNCTFASNLSSERGGGMANGGSSSPTLTACTFLGNGVQSFSAATYGGGMSNYDHSHPTLLDCSFRGNSATGYPGHGGGMYSSGVNPTLTGCAWASNQANYGGAMYNDNASPALTNCTFGLNSAGGDGGGIYSFSSGLTLPLTATNCAFSGNSATGDGGGAFNDLTVLVLTNCTFSGNSAGSLGGGIYNYVGCQVTVTNGVLWGNTHGTADVESAQIFANPSNALVVGHTCIQGLTGGLSGIGNIGGDPLFVDADGPDDIPGTEDDNLRLASGSPCIGAGDNTVVTVSTDLDGHARLLCGVVDMGAYEFGIADFDCDRDVDLDDLAGWSPCVTGPGNGPYDPGCEAFDVDGDTDVDLADFGGFQSAFTGS